MTLCDASVLIDCWNARSGTLAVFRRLVRDGERVVVASPVAYEWRRGSRTVEQLRWEEEWFPPATTLTFGAAEACLASEIYRSVARARGREMDIAIAACALCHQAQVWTLNRADFADIDGIHLVD